MFKMIMDHYGDDGSEENIYMADDFINQSVENDEMSPGEAWFLQGWKGAY